VQIINALYQSARTGRVVPLPRMTHEPGPRRDQAISRPPVGAVKKVKAESPHE
jgi:hypothetical protein